MVIHAVSSEKRRFHFPVFTHDEGHLFLDALRHITYGRITLVTPENKTMDFTGSQPGPVARLMIKDWGVFDDLIARGETGFAEAYRDERCDSPDLPALLTFALVNGETLEHFFHGKPVYALWLRLKNMLKTNSLVGSRRNIMAHYDIGNDFYALWLDNSMTYSSALFEGNVNRTLEEAQQAKYQRILNRLAATPGDHILDIGCGWGGFSIAAARQGMRVTGVTISQEQAALAKQRVKDAGLSSKISIVLKDYRELVGTFDYIVSIGMFEHVGQEYWPGYFRTIRQHLKPGGKAMVQSITLDDALFEKLQGVYGFIEECIFPGGMLPSKFRFRKAAAQQGLICKDVFSFGGDYALTLRHWLARFEAHKEAIAGMGYDKAFIRLWRFYFSSCIASFESKRCDVMQAELSI